MIRQLASPEMGSHTQSMSQVSVHPSDAEIVATGDEGYHLPLPTLKMTMVLHLQKSRLEQCRNGLREFRAHS